MEKVTIYNYEAFFLDFYEGSLDAIQSEALLNFLELHPELKEEFGDFEQIMLPKEEVMFHSKDEIFTDDVSFQSVITIHNFESFAIAKVEGILSESKLKEYHSFLTVHPELKVLDQQYSSTILVADDIEFPNKSQLIRKKKSVLIYLFTASSAVAAAILVFFYLFSPVQVYDYRSVASIKVEQSLEDITFGLNAVESTTDRLVVESAAEALPVLNTINQNQKRLDKVIPVIDKDPAELLAEEKEPLFSEMDEMEVIQMDELAFVETKQPEIITAKAPVKTIRSMQTPMEMIRKEVLNDKPIIEVIADEITAATNEKIKLKAVKGLNRRIEEFALQIGNFSISKKY